VGGRRRFLDYLTVLEQVVRDAARAAEDSEESVPNGVPRIAPA
jgi:hypothetical protein